jgi:hypothetical protein
MSLPLEMTKSAERELSGPEQIGLERALTVWALTLPAARPADDFVTRLGQKLEKNATREADRHRQQVRQLRAAGIIGGVASVVGGVVVWVLWRQRRHQTDDATGGVQPLLASGIKPFLRAHHPARS